MTIKLAQAVPWTPHPRAATSDSRAGSQFVSQANGTRSCCGGWQFEFTGVTPGHRYRIAVDAVLKDVDLPSDAVACLAIWGKVAPDFSRLGMSFFWDYICATASGSEMQRFSGTFIAPEACDTVTIRTTLRWTSRGTVNWSLPELQDLGETAPRPPVRVAVVTGQEGDARASRPTLAEGIDFYAGLTERACEKHGAHLIALPEIGPQWHMPEHAFDKATPVPGPVTDRFAEIARRHDATIVVGLHEREGDAVFNSAVVIDAGGHIAGTYHKVHLASFEAFSGVSPGDDFPVWETRVGRIGCNICMDSSAAESSRMVGLNGGDFLVLPIMGDHRASVWHKGNPVLDEGRWQAIMRTRAMDNQLTMVVARNNSTASCIIDRSGEILAYNDGTADMIVADVTLDDDYRKWNGGCFRQVNWRQRRPGRYGAFVHPAPEALTKLTRGIQTP